MDDESYAGLEGLLKGVGYRVATAVRTNDYMHPSLMISQSVL